MSFNFFSPTYVIPKYKSSQNGAYHHFLGARFYWEWLSLFGGTIISNINNTRPVVMVVDIKLYFTFNMCEYIRLMWVGDRRYGEDNLEEKTREAEIIRMNHLG